MDPEEQARRRRAVEEARDLLADLDAADALRAASSAMPEPSAMQSFGLLPLLSSAQSQRWRREALEVEARHAAERAERKREEQKIMRQRQEAARLEMTAEWAEVLGQVIGAERKYMHAFVTEQLGLLRAELAKSRGVAERGQILDLPAFPVPRKRDPHAA